MIGMIYLSYDNGKHYTCFKNRYYELGNCKRIVTNLLKDNYNTHRVPTNAYITVYDMAFKENLVIK